MKAFLIGVKLRTVRSLQQGKPDPAAHRPYELTISRQTVDKLGVKLYDKASAVVAELVANSYDADAEKVTDRVPYNTLLAKKVKDAGASAKGAEPIEDLGYAIEVVDDRSGAFCQTRTPGLRPRGEGWGSSRL
jgi:hypothetical protein